MARPDGAKPVHGKLVLIMRRKRPADDFLRQSLASKTDACILWPFSFKPNGYPQRAISDLSTERYAHHDAAHSCGNRACVNPAHLRWASRQENMADTVEHGTRVRGAATHNHILTERQVRNVKKRLACGDKRRSIAADLSVSTSAIHAIAQGRTWRHVT